ncbi:ImmA/IrrE family metallo-endopeptidase [Bradyrhizobium sp. HKCCYLS20291]|uniref:ImmA/IrrE family metallo-endopeptidase n=1 Tax=Bradyrhizobium sp. HKCCYLS20291 TaxID=3420766 RepID=UPI003EBFBA24
MTQVDDYKVPFRSEAFIANLAADCRRIGTLPGSKQVDLRVILTELEAHGVESIARIRGMKPKGRLKIEVVDDDTISSPAFVEFRPALKLCIKRSIWHRFQKGYSEERLIIAHELGHIFLHNDEAKRFSRDLSVQIQFADTEDSAEGQAHLFADHLLVPSSLATAINDACRLAFVCNVPEDFAFDRLAAVNREKLPLVSSQRMPTWTEHAPHSVKTGDACPRCGNFEMTAGSGNLSCTFCKLQQSEQRTFGPTPSASTV